MQSTISMICRPPCEEIYISFKHQITRIFCEWLLQYIFATVTLNRLIFMVNDGKWSFYPQSLNYTWINDVAFWTSGSFKSGRSSSCSWLIGFVWLLSNWLGSSPGAFDWLESLFSFGLFFFNLNFPCLQQMMNSKEQRNTRVNRTVRERDLLQTIFTILATKYSTIIAKRFTWYEQHFY